MKTIKDKAHWVMAAAAAVVVSSAVTSRIAAAEDQQANHRILWDATDHVWHCLGSTVDCINNG